MSIPDLPEAEGVQTPLLGDDEKETLLFSEPVRRALRVAQPFYNDEEAFHRGITAAEYEERLQGEGKDNRLCRLQEMSNVDKHRRVAATLRLWPDFAGWALTKALTNAG